MRDAEIVTPGYGRQNLLGGLESVWIMPTRKRDADRVVEEEEKEADEGDEQEEVAKYDNKQPSGPGQQKDPVPPASRHRSVRMSHWLQNNEGISASSSEPVRKKRRLSPLPGTPKQARMEDEFPYSDGENGTRKGAQGENGSAAATPLNLANGSSSHTTHDVVMGEGSESAYQLLPSGASKVASNGTHSPVENPESDVPYAVGAEVMTNQHQPSMMMIREPPVDQLRLPSQHSLGTIHETEILRNSDDVAPPPPPQESYPHSVQRQHPMESTGRSMPTPNRFGSAPASASTLAHRCFSPGNDGSQEESSAFVVDAVEERVTTVPSRPFSIWRSTLFWYIAVFVLQIAYLEFWINPILQSVVVSSKSLAAFYKSAIPFNAAPSLPEPIPLSSTTDDMDVNKAESHENESHENELVLEIASESGLTEELPFDYVIEIAQPQTPRVNLTLVKEKLVIRERNKYVAVLNLQTENENAQRRELNTKRKEQINTLIESNQRVEMENRIVLDELVWLEDSFHDLDRDKLVLSQSMDDLLQQVHSLLDRFQVQRHTLSDLLLEVAANQERASRELELTNEIVSDDLAAMDELVEVLTSLSQGDNHAADQDQISNIRLLLGESEDLLLDVFAFEMWKPSIASLYCEVPSFTFNDTEVNDSITPAPVVTLQMVEELVEEFKTEIEEETDYVLDAESFSEDIQTLVEGIAEDFPLDALLLDAPELPVPNYTSTIIGLAKGDIQTMVSSRLAKDQADQTGRIDFASMFNGAKILSDATSPSFVDKLPVLNRIGALLSLHSHGYGPGAALTPTWPKNQLGQCWSFERDTSEYNDGSGPRRIGRFADLSVRLARPTAVGSVSIEHPPAEISHGATSAIKQFQVIGYVNGDASGEAWHLGRFTYDIRDPSKHPRQEFQVLRQVGGQDVPILGSITLGIDSNWGEPVACLYRFRVHSMDDL